MARQRGKTNTPEDATKEFFTIESVPKSWLSLPTTKKEAKEKNLKWYFNRKPCTKKGHFSVRLIASQSCNTCNSIRQKSSAYQKDYYQKNREKFNSKARERRADKNDDFHKLEKARGKRYRDKNIAKVRARGREKAKARYWEDPERAREYARELSKTDNHKQQRNQRLANKRHSDPAFLIEERARTRIRGVFRRRSIPKQGTTKELLGLEDWKDLSSHIEANFLDGMTWDNQAQWDIDHIRPCSTFDLESNEEQLKVCFNWMNLRPLWKRLNEQKGDDYGPLDELAWVERMQALGYEGELFLKYEEGNSY